MNSVSFLSAFALCLLFCGLLLPILKRAKAGQEILEYVTEHSGKQGTPTMGGIAFIAAIALASAILSLVIPTYGSCRSGIRCVRHSGFFGRFYKNSL